jgi:hypothetical protein
VLLSKGVRTYFVKSKAPVPELHPVNRTRKRKPLTG